MASNTVSDTKLKGMKTNHHEHCLYVEALNVLNDPFAEQNTLTGIVGMQNHSIPVEDQNRVTFPGKCE